MNKLEKELAFLEAIESIPQPPNPLPLSLIYPDGKTRVPVGILEYFTGIDVEIETDENGRYPAKEYTELLKKYNVPMPVKLMRLVRPKIKETNIQQS